LLPAAAALLPAAAVSIAWWLSVRAGYIPDCIPHFEGCTSISRAARYGVGNLVFELVMIPCAFVHAAMWLQARAWVRGRHPDPHAGRSLVSLGLVAGAALIVYSAFLGTDGAVYQWMRRFGIVFYFGATVLAIFVFTHRLAQLHVETRITAAMQLVCGLLLALGLASVGARAIESDPELRDRLEDMLEWQLGTLIVIWPLVLAALWRRTGR